MLFRSITGIDSDEMDSSEVEEYNGSVSPTPEFSAQLLNSSDNEKDGRLVIVQQYFKEIENSHGISFLFNLIPKEPFFKTRERLHKKFGLGQKEFSKIKLGILFSTPEGRSFKSFQHFNKETLENMILFNLMSNSDIIFMDHPDRLRSHNAQDRPMIIKN